MSVLASENYNVISSGGGYYKVDTSQKTAVEVREVQGKCQVDKHTTMHVLKQLLNS